MLPAATLPAVHWIGTELAGDEGARGGAGQGEGWRVAAWMVIDWVRWE